MITGRDNKSLQALDMLNNKITHQEIAEKLNISINNVKRLSRYNNLLNQSKEHLSESLVEKIKALGLKVLPLAKLFKIEDYEGLEEILRSIPTHIKRAEINNYITVLEKKRKEVKEVRTDTKLKIARLKEDEDVINQEIIEFETAAEKKKQIKTLIEKLDKKKKDFLEDHLGFYKGSIALNRKIHSDWEQELYRKKIIQYVKDIDNWAWYDLVIILDIQRFIESLKERLTNKKKVKFYKTFYWRIITSFDTNFKILINQQKETLEEIQNEKAEYKQKLENAKTTSVTEFMNKSKIEKYDEDMQQNLLKRNQEAKQEVMKYFFEKGYVVVDGITEIPFVVGYNEEKNIVIIDIYNKGSVQIKEWKEYLNYCNQMYIIIRKYDYNYGSLEIKRELNAMGIGLLIPTNNYRNKLVFEEKEKAKTREIPNENKKKIIFEISRKVSKKLIFG
jgi:hypothetical protein